ncbi:MAG: metal-dependent hydrolase [Acidobacteriaceae bacterium]|nr:metal-dependent hydrolase [Acidobacteriaceae bacterium]MBV9779796.1 metal-dependent hydrolase [Acidobacteriaceae bacterium]
MDNLTHSLTGLALARSGLNRYCPHASLLMILSANAPDLDIVGLRGGQLRYFEWHRGYSHSVSCLPFLALLPVFVVALIYRRKLPWTKAWLLCCLGIGSHLMMDWTNSYGVRLLLPFSSRWFSLDLNGLYDAWILAVLAFAALWPAFARLVSGEIGARFSGGRGTAIFALVFFVLFDLSRLLLHQRAIAQIEARLYENSPPVKTAALPESFNPFRWTGVVETSNQYRLLTVNSFGNIDLEEGAIFYKPAARDSIYNAKQTEPFRYFLYFSRFPVWSELPFAKGEQMGIKIDLTDLRFGTPWAGSFHCNAIENSRNHVLRSWFTYGADSDLGQGAR